MNTEGLNQYIYNYIKEDKSKQAIMLNGEWGIGKSYYIKEELVNYLKKNNIETIIVSVYGLRNIAELSKAIYFESRINKVIKKAEKATVIAKVILKGISSFYGINLSVSDKDIIKLFKKTNLKDTLIIIEDLERSNIDIYEVLGYVNDIIDEEGKVLFVANEKELIKRAEKHEVNNFKKESEGKRKNNDFENRYLMHKEKTIGDTLEFNGNVKEAVRQFLLMLNWQRGINVNGITERIENICEEIGSKNLRAVIYAIQKTKDIFSNDKNSDPDFVDSVLFANIAFILKMKRGDDIAWENGELKISIQLGAKDFPLYKFAYDYILKQKLDKEEIVYANRSFLDRKEENKNNVEVWKHLKILYTFDTQNEATLMQAVAKIKEQLDQNKISFIEYGKLANYLVAVRKLIDEEKLIDECKKAMLSRIRERKEEEGLYEKILFPPSGVELWEEEQKEEFNIFIKEMLTELQLKKWDVNDIFGKGKNYILEELLKYRTDIIQKTTTIIHDIDIERLLHMLPKYDAAQVEGDRCFFIEVYRSHYIKIWTDQDKKKLELLSKEINVCISKSSDKIVRQQLRWYSNALERIFEEHYK